MKTNRFGALMLLMLAAIISWSTANAQSFTVKGIVTDAESGEAIIGCSVVIDGTRNGTTTGTDGTYSIHVSKGATLVFSFVGYRTQKIKVVSTRIDVALKADTQTLEECIVVGYANEARKMVCGATPLSMVRSMPCYGKISSEEYKEIQENGFKQVLDTPLSTFSIDVDAASYSNMRRFLNKGELPPTNAIRTEEKKEDLVATVRKDSATIQKGLITGNREKKVVVSPHTEVPQAMTQEWIDEALETTIAEEPLAATTSSAMKSIPANDSSLTAQVAVAGKVHGTVTDSNGYPIVGATVKLKGTNQGTISDVNGNFVLKTGGNRELAVDYIGYESVTLPADTTKSLLIAMNEDQATLDEVVVVGYGSQSKGSITGAVASLKMSGTPQPTIGRKAFRKYLKESLVHPSDKDCARAKGKVILTFRVDKEGRPQDITVKKGLCASADEEAIRLIEEGPDWTMGEEPVEISIRF
jgi:hypothetical protein